jgi:hypothetical protein
LTYKLNPTETSSNSNPSEATTVTDASGVLRTFNRDVQLVDASGDPIGKTASPSTAWKYSRIVSINGADYYQVAPNEYLPTDSSVKFIPLTTPTNIVLSSNSVVYNSEGNALDVTFPAGTILKTDGYAIINGVKMYRVGTDEWVSGDSQLPTNLMSRFILLSRQPLFIMVLANKFQSYPQIPNGTSTESSLLMASNITGLQPMNLF